MRLICFLLFILISSTTNAQQKVVVKEHPDGTPHVIFYMSGKGSKAVKVKEEGYYPNGNMEYSGEVKNNAENGEWKYYYENGNIKAIEFWKNGVETGTWKEFHPDGQLATETVYKNGKVIQTITK